MTAAGLYRARLGAGSDPVAGSRILAGRIVERAPVASAPLSGCALSDLLLVRPVSARTASRRAVVHVARGGFTLCGRPVAGWDTVAGVVSCAVCVDVLARHGQVAA